MEFAGLVLGALPILYGSVRVYRDTSRTIQRVLGKKIYVGQLLESLALLEVTLKLLLRKLLQDSGCENSWNFESDPFKYLSDRDVQEQLQEYLGPGVEEIFGNTMEQICNVIRETAKSIRGMVPELKDNSTDDLRQDNSTDDLRQIIEANKNQKGGHLEFVPRIKFALKASELKNTVKELGDSVTGLQRIIELIGKNEPSVAEKLSVNTKRFARGISRVQRLADNLHVAISRSWGSKCHINHAAKLFLDDRLDPASKNDTKHISFGLIFAANIVRGQSLWHETTVRVVENFEPPSDTASTTQSLNARRVTIVIPKIITSEKAITTIDDICGAIELARGQNEKFTFVLIMDQRIGSIPSDCGLLDRYSNGNETPLSALLMSDQYSGFKHLDLRMFLALRIATNILQLFKTRWLQRVWSRNEIYFPTSRGVDAPDLNRPFISVLFEGCDKGGEAQSQVDLRTAILELGILLLEIWNWEAFVLPNPRPPAPGGLVLYNQRHTHAFAWMQETKITGTVPPLYYDAVHFCISGMDGQARYLGWEDPKLWTVLCQNVVEPLYKNCGYWTQRT
ncbi:hypothetical protein TWF481_003248 [Arthrobotrys musiformis]|uniref:DUF7580 domain-containing protein n=1 Tax=Arthrobotrys musiformis TaxID=47236 RepID=A0AAV9VPP0_9PEZI